MSLSGKSAIEGFRWLPGTPWRSHRSLQLLIRARPHVLSGPTLALPRAFPRPVAEPKARAPWSKASRMRARAEAKAASKAHEQRSREAEPASPPLPLGEAGCAIPLQNIDSSPSTNSSQAQQPLVDEYSALVASQEGAFEDDDLEYVPEGFLT